MLELLLYQCSCYITKLLYYKQHGTSKTKQQQKELNQPNKKLDMSISGAKINDLYMMS